MRRADLVLPDDYPQLLAEIQRQVRSAQVKAHRAANTEMLRLYWTIGKAILARQETGGWGAKVIDRLSVDLRTEFPTMKGLGRSNLEYMRRFAAAYPEAIPQQTVGELPWGHITVLLDKVGDPVQRDWYARSAVTAGWSRDVLRNQIMGQLHRRVGAAPSNFRHQLEVDSELAQQLVKDPYVFDFLGLTGQVAERQLEDALMDRLRDFLLELGDGFAFAGRQVQFSVDGDDFFIDLLFFHTTQLRWVVVELKIGKFRPEYLGQLGMYVALVDDVKRIAGVHNPTVGILLCASRNERVVRYSLRGSNAALAVASYTYDTLPEDERAGLPDATELAAALDVLDEFQASGTVLDT